jgi:hypothetical protein
MKMVTATLYILTALVTGLHNFYWLMEMVNGAPLHLLNLIALLGAVTLVVAAVAALLRPHIGAKIGLAGSFLLWVYYAPSIAISFFMPFSTWQSIRQFISFHDYIPVVGIFVAPILLIATTATSALFLKAKSFHEKAG